MIFLIFGGGDRTKNLDFHRVKMTSLGDNFFSKSFAKSYEKLLFLIFGGGDRTKNLDFHRVKMTSLGDKKFFKEVGTGDDVVKNRDFQNEFTWPIFRCPKQFNLYNSK